MKFILLINVKMPTIVGILTFISRINKTSDRSKARNLVIFQHFNFYKQWKLHAKMSCASKKFYNVRASPVCSRILCPHLYVQL